MSEIPAQLAETVVKKNGRPSKRTPELTEEICARLATGEPMSHIAKDAHVPDLVTIYRWLRENDEFRQLYETARADGAHTYASQIAEIIDKEPNKTYDEAGNMKYDPASIAFNRLRMDGRKWLAAKYLPKVYGERQILAGDADNPIQVNNSADAYMSAVMKKIEDDRRKE